MRALRKADAVIAICEGIRQDLLRRGLAAEKITLVPNAVDNARFAAAKPRDMKIAQSLGLEGTFVLGFIGSFYRYEGLDLLLQAFGSLRDSLPSARLLLVGGGPEEAVLLEKSRALGLEDRIKFVGRVPNEAIEAYYGLLDLAVYPRRTSRLTELVTPLKPLEAMAYGIPVLASAVGGHRELIEDRKTGHLFAADSVDALCSAILAAARNQDVLTLTAKAAKDYVTKQRDWAVVAANYVDFYRDLVR
jgi:glycosyltransferase involved in cell wall biosynthesis